MRANAQVLPPPNLWADNPGRQFAGHSGNTRKYSPFAHANDLNNSSFKQLPSSTISLSLRPHPAFWVTVLIPESFPFRRTQTRIFRDRSSLHLMAFARNLPRKCNNVEDCMGDVRELDLKMADIPAAHILLARIQTQRALSTIA